MKCSWVDLPRDDFSLILGYQKTEICDLNEMSQAYHDIPKDDADCIQIRVDRLEDIIEHLENWIGQKICNKDKIKHLVTLKEIAELKTSYLLELIKMSKINEPIADFLHRYHNDVVNLCDLDMEVLFLNPLRMYSVKKREAWGDFWSVSLDPCHRQLTNYLQIWENNTGHDQPSLDFFLWLETQYVPQQQPIENYLSKEDIIKNHLVVEKGEISISITNVIANFSEPEKNYLFIVDLEKELFVIEETESIFHSCLCQGKPILSAGKIVIKEGHITDVSFESGHYIPSINAGYQLFKVLIENNYEMPPSVNVSFFFDRNKYTVTVKRCFFYSYENFENKLEEAIGLYQH
jgi:hypothetical protein